MGIAYQTAYADVYSRVKTDADGAAVRALAGSASSVFPADELGNVTGKVFPWLVWRPVAVGGTSGEMRDLAGSWWVYDAPGAGSYRLYQIASALEALYGGVNVLDMPYARTFVTHIGRPETDAALNGAVGLEVRIGYRRLG